MSILTRLSTDAFEELQLDAGTILLEEGFDPLNPYIVPEDQYILATTTGNINPSCVPRTSDFFEDVNGAPNNTKEGLHIDGWDASIGFTSVRFNAAGIKYAFGFADISTLTNGVRKITPRRKANSDDFAGIWFVAPKANGGGVAIHLKNAVSTGGLSMTTTKNNKGTMALTISGFVSIYDSEDVPMEAYEIPPQNSENVFPVVQRLSHVTSSYSSATIAVDGSLTATLTAASDYTLDDDSVKVTMGGVDITAMAYNSSQDKVTIAAVTGGVVISASATPNT